MRRSRIGAVGFMVAALMAVAAAVAMVGCAGASEDPPTATPAPFEITSPLGRVFTDSTVLFTLVDRASSEAVEATWWGISTPHNVPGDRGIMRSDGLYTAPRIVPEPRTVRIYARSGRAEASREFDIFDPARLDPDATSVPGDGHTIYSIHDFETTRPLEQGLRVGESVGISATDGTGRPLVVDHYEIEHDNRVVDYAGTITRDGVYTAPLGVPDPPHVQVNILFLREGGEPGQLSLLGKSFEILPH